MLQNQAKKLEMENKQLMKKITYVRYSVGS